jgi:hypothetical protein
LKPVLWSNKFLFGAPAKSSVCVCIHDACMLLPFGRRLSSQTIPGNETHNGCTSPASLSCGSYFAAMLSSFSYPEQCMHNRSREVASELGEEPKGFLEASRCDGSPPSMCFLDKSTTSTTPLVTTTMAMVMLQWRHFRSRCPCFSSRINLFHI